MVEAKINKNMMYWARKNAGFINGYEDQLPKSIKSRYESWENGDKYPTWNQLREVSKKYNLPTAFFFLKKPIEYMGIPELINYRKLEDELFYNSNSPSLIANIRKSETRRNIYLDLLKDMDQEILSFKKFESPKNKFEFSNFIRKSLDISLDDQKSWFNKNDSNDYKHYNFLNNWKNILNEKFGILTFETKDVDIKEMRGLCIFHEKIPIILLNGKDAVNGRIFSLFHELTHLLLGESAICGDDLERDIEIFCNSVAGEFLVPTIDLKRNIHNNSLKEMSNIYGVSEYVILRRLYDNKYISKKEYDSKTKSLDETIHKKPESSSGNYLNNMIKYNSKPYYSLILTAYESGFINTLDFTKFTNLNKKQIVKLQEKFYEGNE